MNKYIKKILLCGAAALNLFCAFAQNASAEVFAVDNIGGYPDAVYIAGNPDMYPIEYYDAESKSYKGVIPDMLKIVSEKTGIDFMYICRGMDNMQEELSRNGQVEMLTAVSADAEYDFTQKIPVISYEKDGMPQTYCICFTRTADSAKKTLTETALSRIMDTQKNGLLISNTDRPKRGYKNVMIAVAATLLVCCLLAAAVLLGVYKKKKKGFSTDNYIDELTGVGNADYYIYVFDKFISDQTKNLYSVAYIAFDCEKTERLWGEKAVSEIEKHAAVKLNTYAGSTEYVSRVHRGAFAFLYQCGNDEECSERISLAVNGINNYLSEFDSEYKKLFSAGICRLCQHVGADSETALYNAKQGYMYAVSKNILCHIGSKKQLVQNLKEEELRRTAGKAIKNDEFKIYLQLIHDRNTGKFCGAEVLSRWQNIKYGLLKPYEYIKILKQSETIIEHDYKIFQHTCALLEQWNTPSRKNLFLTCNFTRLSVVKEDFPQTLGKISDGYDFMHERLIIEITEDSLDADNGILSKNIAECKALGFKIAIDDMGAGFSSLADIYDNEVDIVKIERNFISACITERRQKMLGDIIALVHNAGAKIVCEGVETEEQSIMLKELNCDMLQGYYYSHVLPVEECERILSASG